MRTSLTLADVRAQLGWMFTSADDLLQNLNQARAAIIQNGQWHGAKVSVTFNGSTGYITLGARYESILGATIMNCPASVYDELNQYVESGAGTLDFTKPGWGGIQFVGDQFVTTIQDHIAGQQLRFTISNAADAAVSLRILGTDTSNSPIEDNVGAEGQNLVLANPTTTFPTALNTFYGLVKPAMKGTLSVYSWDGTTATLLSVYEPWETNPQYARYGTGTYNSTTPIKCLCKLKYYPLVADTDFCIPDDINGLELALQAIDLQHVRQYEERDNAWARCYSLLNDQIKSLRGKAQPSLTYLGPTSNNSRTKVN